MRVSRLFRPQILEISGLGSKIMLYEFQSAEQIASDFELGIFVWVGILLLVVVAINFPLPNDLKKLLPPNKTNSSSPFKFLSATLLGLLVLIIIFFSYTSSFSRFSALLVIPYKGISITYSSLYPRTERQEFVPIESIQSIEYGQRGKIFGGESSCFIRIVTMAGPNHRSAYRHMSRSQCHNVQTHIVGALCQSGTKPFTRPELKNGKLFRFCRD